MSVVVMDIHVSLMLPVYKNYRMATKLLRLTSDDKREAKREGVFHNGEQLALLYTCSIYIVHVCICTL